MTDSKRARWFDPILLAMEAAPPIVPILGLPAVVYAAWLTWRHGPEIALRIVAEAIVVSYNPNIAKGMRSR